jgi:putative IMPACT (imprinted ancient) family translation regulator
VGLLQSKVKIAMVHKTLACQYSQVDDVLHLLRHVEGEVLAQDYQQTVNFRLAIPAAKLALMQEQLQTLSAGQLLLIAVE